MFKNVFQPNLISLFFSLCSEPLQLWSTEWPEDMKTDEGIRLVVDEEVQSAVLEIKGSNLMDTFISCPTDPKKSLDISRPNFVMILKDLNMFFSFEIEVQDDRDLTRRLRASNFLEKAKLTPTIANIPLCFSEEGGWNIVCVDLAGLVKRLYGTNLRVTKRVTIHSNCRLRRVYFADRLYSQEELPVEFKLLAPVSISVIPRLSSPTEQQPHW